MLGMRTERELAPTNGQKSYYGKAMIMTDYKGNYWLRSYDTVVCGFVHGKFHRTWDYYSATSMKHIKSFVETVAELAKVDFKTMNKATWDGIEYERFSELVNA